MPEMFLPIAREECLQLLEAAKNGLSMQNLTPEQALVKIEKGYFDQLVKIRPTYYTAMQLPYLLQYGGTSFEITKPETI